MWPNYEMLFEIPLEGLRRDYIYPIPQFHGKKGERPEDHYLKVEKKLAHFHVTENDKIDRSRETLFSPI